MVLPFFGRSFIFITSLILNGFANKLYALNRYNHNLFAALKRLVVVNTPCRPYLRANLDFAAARKIVDALEHSAFFTDRIIYRAEGRYTLLFEYYNDDYRKYTYSQKRGNRDKI